MLESGTSAKAAGAKQAYTKYTHIACMFAGILGTPQMERWGGRSKASAAIVMICLGLDGCITHSCSQD